MKNKEIQIWTYKTEDKKAALPGFGNKTSELVKISQDEIAKNIKEFLDSSNSILDVDTSKESKLYVDELEISLAINASGGVELIGKLEAGAQAGIKIKLKRKEV